MPVVLHGPAYSTYARTARLALEEKGVAYELNEVDIMKGAGASADHLARHPWGKVPALEHDGFLLFETFAIARYVDEAFPGPALQPADAKARARMTQICGVVDSYAYKPMVHDVFIQAVFVPAGGGTTDAAVFSGGLEQAGKALDALESLVVESEGLCGGGGISLADIHLAPVLTYFTMVPQGAEALAQRPLLSAWWKRIGERPSVVKTMPKLG
ncbi:glutathione S-transferase family protein [Roseomonas sp. CCTCC AB2023176]|uniref:glutathione S-transferase family protein n=1 Tax=Roseomonas sp. CCTCC AB2023176 TaxID=3342640 RepID=UPI0035DB899D